MSQPGADWYGVVPNLLAIELVRLKFVRLDPVRADPFPTEVECDAEPENRYQGDD